MRRLRMDQTSPASSWILASSPDAGKPLSTTNWELELTPDDGDSPLTARWIETAGPRIERCDGGGVARSIGGTRGTMSIAAEIGSGLATGSVWGTGSLGPRRETRGLSSSGGSGIDGAGTFGSGAPRRRFRGERPSISGENLRVRWSNGPGGRLLDDRGPRGPRGLNSAAMDSLGTEFRSGTAPNAFPRRPLSVAVSGIFEWDRGAARCGASALGRVPNGVGNLDPK